MDNVYEFIEKFFVPAVLPILTIIITYHLQNRKVDSIQKGMDDIKKSFDFIDLLKNIYEKLNKNNLEIENNGFKIVRRGNTKGYKSLIKNNKGDVYIGIDKDSLLYIYVDKKSTNFASYSQIENEKDFKKIEDNTYYNVYHKDYENIFNKTNENIYNGIKLYMETINKFTK